MTAGMNEMTLDTNNRNTETKEMTYIWEQAIEKMKKTANRIKDGFPHVSLNGQYNDEGPGWWTSGFWPGILWQLYRVTGDEALKTYARSCEDQQDQVLYGFETVHHDVGFMWILSALADYKLTGDKVSRKRALVAASYLASRFNLKGGFIRAWTKEVFEDCQGWAIIDCMMNIPLLYWASEELDDPRFRHIAMAHADTVIKEFIREDGSVHHIVCFDPETGERTGALAGQGFSEDSAWARGSAWAIYGFALSYRYTGEKRYLDTALKAARFFMASLEDNGIPKWDFRASEDKNDAWDSSAASCAASGLLELAALTEGDTSDWSRASAIDLLTSLAEHCQPGDGEEALLADGTVNYNRDKHVNTPIIYGDFYYLEALGKLNGQTEIFW